MKILVIKCAYVQIKRKALVDPETKLVYAVADEHGNCYFVSEIGMVVMDTEQQITRAIRALSFNSGIDIHNMHHSRFTENTLLTRQAKIAYYGYGTRMHGEDGVQVDVRRLLRKEIDRLEPDAAVYKGGVCEYALLSMTGGIILERIFNLEDIGCIRRAPRFDDYRTWHVKQRFSDEDYDIEKKQRREMCRAHHFLSIGIVPQFVEKILFNKNLPPAVCCSRAASLRCAKNMGEMHFDEDIAKKVKKLRDSDW